MTPKEIKPGDSLLCGVCGDAFEAEKASKPLNQAAVGIAKPTLGSVGSSSTGKAQSKSSSSSSLSSLSASSSVIQTSLLGKRPRLEQPSTSRDKPPSSGRDEQTDS